MNVRRTSLLIVLALALAACAAPIQVPPIRPQQPSTQQEALPFLNETKQGQTPAVTAPEVFVPEIKAPTSKAELPSMEELAKVFPWVQQAQATELRRVPTLEELTLGVPMQIHDQIKQYVDDLNLPATPMYERDRSWLEQAPALPATPMFERDRWWLEEQTPAPAQTLDLEQITRGVPPQIYGDIARVVGAKQFIKEMNATTLPAEIVRDQWWAEETTPLAPAPAAADLSLRTLTLGVPQQIHEDIAHFVMATKAPQIEALTRGLPIEVQPAIVRFVMNQ
jgi:hypothetical protein